MGLPRRWGLRREAPACVLAAFSALRFSNEGRFLPAGLRWQGLDWLFRRRPFPVGVPPVWGAFFRL